MTDLNAQVAGMSKAVLKMLEISTEKMDCFDESRNEKIQAFEIEVNRSQMRIDDLAWKIMALYQPTATDLRTLIGAIKIASDLERAGDAICALCRRAMTISGMPWKNEPAILFELEIMVRSLFKDGLTVLSTLDESLAESIFIADQTLNETFQLLFETIRAQMKAEPEHIDVLLEYLAMGRSLERIGDLSTNLAEVAVFMKKGQDVRHHGLSF